MTARAANRMPDLVNRRAPVHYVTGLNQLMRLGIDIAQIDILAVGEYENYHGEIRRQTPTPGTEIGPSTKVVLEVGFPSAVDIMPYQFFYGLAGTGRGGSGWEENARRLMAPFDGAIIRRNARAQYHSLKLAFGYLDREQLERFVRLFGIDCQGIALTDRDLLLLATLLPAFSQWTGNPSAVAIVLELFFGYQFEIAESVPRRYQIPRELQYRLADTDATLGRETTVGQSFVECDSAYRVIVHGVEPDRIAGWLAGKPQRRKLEWLLQLAMPGNLRGEIQVLSVQAGYPLGTDDHESYLGHSVYLSRTRPNSP